MQAELNWVSHPMTNNSLQLSLAEAQYNNIHLFKATAFPESQLAFSHLSPQ